jgi:hypothetical protein
MGHSMGSADAPMRLVAGQGRAPSLVLLGAPRCGTTALATWLRDAGIGVGVKDSFYLMDDDAGLRGPTHISTHGVQGYLDLFPPTPGATAECAAGYLYQRSAREFFSSWDMPPEFAVIVRDPIARLRSVHRYFCGNLGLLPPAMTFDEYVDALFSESIELDDQTVSNALNQGCYATALKPWIDSFGSDHIHLLRFDDLEKTPDSILSRLIDLASSTPSIDLDAYAFERHNNSYVPRSARVARATVWARRWMPSGRLRAWGGEKLRRMQSRDVAQADKAYVGDSADTTRRLRDFYADSIAALSRIHGLDTSNWA